MFLGLTVGLKEELNDEAAGRLVPEGCFGAGMAHWSHPEVQESGLQSLGGGAQSHGEMALFTQRLPEEGSASQGGSVSSLEFILQHPVHSRGSGEGIRALCQVGGRENSWESILEVQVRDDEGLKYSHSQGHRGGRDGRVGR